MCIEQGYIEHGQITVLNTLGYTTIRHKMSLLKVQDKVPPKT